MQTPSLSRQAVLQSPSARQGCPVSVLQRRTYKDARQTTTCLRAHQEQREPQDHSLEDLLVRSEESPCENTDAPWVPAKSSSQTPTEIVSPTVSPASEAISQKLCFQPKSKAASPRTTRQTQTRCPRPSSPSQGAQKRPTDNNMSVERIKIFNESLRTIA